MDHQDSTARRDLGKRIPIHGIYPKSPQARIHEEWGGVAIFDQANATLREEVNALSKLAKGARQGNTWWVGEFQLSAAGNVDIKLKPIMLQSRPYVEVLSYGLCVARVGDCISMCQIGGYKTIDDACHQVVWLDLTSDYGNGPDQELFEVNKEAYFSQLQLHDEYCKGLREERYAEAKRDGLRLSTAGKSRRKVERKLKFLLQKYEKHIKYTLVSRANEPDWD